MFFQRNMLLQNLYSISLTDYNSDTKGPRLGQQALLSPRGAMQGPTGVNAPLRYDIKKCPAFSLSSRAIFLHLFLPCFSHSSSFWVAVASSFAESIDRLLRHTSRNLTSNSAQLVLNRALRSDRF